MYFLSRLSRRPEAYYPHYAPSLTPSLLSIRESYDVTGKIEKTNNPGGHKNMKRRKGAELSTSGNGSLVFIVNVV